jgi:RecG-like helicase
MKYDPIKDYSESFNEEYLKMLMDIKEGPEMFDVEVGEVLTGVIESINKKEIIININYKDSVYVDIKKTDLNIVHNPPDFEKLKESMIRLKYEELFEFTFKINYLKEQGYEFRTFYDFVKNGEKGV